MHGYSPKKTHTHTHTQKDSSVLKCPGALDQGCFLAWSLEWAGKCRLPEIPLSSCYESTRPGTDHAHPMPTCCPRCLLEPRTAPAGCSLGGRAAWSCGRLAAGSPGRGALIPCAPWDRGAQGEAGPGESHGQSEEQCPRRLVRPQSPHNGFPDGFTKAYKSGTPLACKYQR